MNMNINNFAVDREAHRLAWCRYGSGQRLAIRAPLSYTQKAPSYVQLQHPRIRVIDHKEGFRLVKVIALIDGNESTKPTTPKDLDPADIRLEHLRNTLPGTEDLAFEENSQLVWTAADSDQITICHDSDLVTALTEFQTYGKGSVVFDTISMYTQNLATSED